MFDVEKIKTWEVSYVHNWSWGEGGFRENFTKEEFEDAKRAFLDITVNNIGFFLKIRWNCFKATMGVDKMDGIHFLLRSHHNFSGDYEFYNMQTVKGFHILNEELRLKLLNGLMFCDINNDCFWKVGYRIFFNGIPAIICIGGMLVLCRKNRCKIIINMGFILLTGVLFLLTPEASMQYYVPVLIYGNGLFWYTCMAYFAKVKRGKTV